MILNDLKLKVLFGLLISVALFSCNLRILNNTDITYASDQPILATFR